MNGHVNKPVLILKGKMLLWAGLISFGLWLLFYSLFLVIKGFF